MKKIWFAILGGVLGVGLMNGPALADNFMGNFRSQGGDIRQGAASGQLTRQETQRLLRELYRIRTVYARSLADGRISAFEKRRIQRLRANLDWRIHRLENNQWFRVTKRGVPERSGRFDSGRRSPAAPEWKHPEKHRLQETRPPMGRHGQTGWKPL